MSEMGNQRGFVCLVFFVFRETLSARPHSPRYYGMEEDCIKQDDDYYQ